MEWSSLVLQNITLEYRQRGLPAIVALSGVSTDPIKKGSLVLVEGDNGSGKTSLLEVLAGRREASAGEVQLDEHVMTPSSLRLRTNIAYVPQKPTEGIVSCMTVEENLALRRVVLGESSLRSIGKTVGVEELEKVREKYGIEFLTPDRLKADPRGLSGGQQQILTVLSCLLAAPEILLMDEPTSKLSPVRRGTVWRIVADVRDAGATVFVASHEEGPDLAELADIHMKLDGGGIKEFDVRTRPEDGLL